MNAGCPENLAPGFDTTAPLLITRAGAIAFVSNNGWAREQWIKEGNNAVKWTRLSSLPFKDNQVRLQLFALSCNLGYFLRQLALSCPNQDRGGSNDMSDERIQIQNN